MSGLARRILFAPVVLVAVAVILYGSLRILRPDLYPGDPLLSGIVHDLNRALLHLDLGCAPPGGTGSGARPSGKCLPVRVLLQRGMAADIWLLVGSIVIGGVGGVLGGLWCAGHPRARASRALQAGAALAYCAPVYAVGLALLLLFSPDVGLVHVPFFFDAEPRWVQPWNAPWDWFRQLLVPWIVLAAPLGAMCLRLTLSLTREAMDEDFVRTAEAKGVHRRDIVRRHAAPISYPSTFSFLAVSAPLLITNMVLVERTLSVPGFFKYTWRASGLADPSVMQRDPAPDYALLSALCLWGAVLLIVLGLIADAIVSRLDPRVRSSHGQAW